MYVLLSGLPPFYGKDKQEVYNSIIKDALDLQSSKWEIVSAEAKDFLTKVLDKNPHTRLSAKQALDHPWLAFGNQRGEEVQLTYIVNNLTKFCSTTNFQKLIISVLSNLKVQQEELKLLKEAFLQMDTNCDGCLTLDELVNGLSKLSLFEILQTHQLEHEEILSKTYHSKDSVGEDDPYAHILRHIDLDGDGRIDYNEFVQATINQKALLNEENVRRIFNMIDANSDGELTKEELKNFFSPSMLNEKPEELQLLQEIMNEVDQDRDNLITYKEFNDALTEILNKTIN